MEKAAYIYQSCHKFQVYLWYMITYFCFFSFSVKVEGERLYEKARRGEKIDVPARKITIYDFQIERNKEDRSNLITTYYTSDICGILLCLL